MPKVFDTEWKAGPIVDGTEGAGEQSRDVVSPQNFDQRIGTAAEATDADIDKAIASAAKAAPAWAARPAEERALCLERAADLMEEDMARLMALCTLEAGKTVLDGVAEIREAVDFCRYYANRARDDLGAGVRLRAPDTGGRMAELAGGRVFTCISPWNFPFAIFCGQVTAALAAGNAVLAKPAEQTPVIAAEAVKLLHKAGIPADVLHLLPGDGARVGAALVRDERIGGVCFTGSTEVARLINRTLAGRSGTMPPLIAETGGQNAMIVDSTALPEQVTRDVMMSSFQSAGQRCSALRVMFVQEDVAERTINMIAGAMEELTVSDPAYISTDVGPVIDTEARDMLNGHIKRMLGEGNEIMRTKLGAGTEHGCFVTPAAFEIDSLSQLQREVFGPVLHVVRFKSTKMNAVVDAINATGYGLTMGIHTRIDDNWRRIYAAAHVGNTYVNRNQIGAIVGVQPFGGQGLSGTGPKAGGPHYLHRFVSETGDSIPGGEWAAASLDDACIDRAQLAGLIDAAIWAESVTRRCDVIEDVADALEKGDVRGIAPDEAARAAQYLRAYAAHVDADFAEPATLPGPTGERNEMSLTPRGPVLCMATGGDGSAGALIAEVGAALAAGNAAILWHPDPEITSAIAAVFHDAGVTRDTLVGVAPGSDGTLGDLVSVPGIEAVAVAGPLAFISAINAALAASDAAIRPVIAFREDPVGDIGAGQPLAGSPHYLHRFVHERSLSIDTTASGGNASLLSIGDGSSSLPGEG